MKLFVGAKGIISRPDGKILIVREGGNYIDGTESGKWDVVGGRIEPDEPLLDGLQREIKEESGLSVSTGPVISVAETWPVIHGEECHIIRVYYRCNTSEDKVVLSEDHDAYEWIDPSDYSNFNIMEDLVAVFKLYINKS